MIYGIPPWLFWAAGIAGIVVGALIVIAGERSQRWMRQLLLWQLKRMRGTRYRKFLRFNGWTLLVLGTLMIVLLSLDCRTAL